MTVDLTSLWCVRLKSFTAMQSVIINKYLELEKTFFLEPFFQGIVFKSLVRPVKTRSTAVLEISQQQLQQQPSLTNLVSFFKTLLSMIELKILFLDGVLITGGGLSVEDSVELYLPSTGVSCSLPQLPDERHGHTLESSGLLCGGWYRYNCLQWSPDNGTWEELLTLEVRRENHVSWTPGKDIGTYLMGGHNNWMTTTLVKHDGTTLESGFPLKYNTE